MRILGLLTVFLCAAPIVAAAQDRADMIISRDAKTVEIFFSMPATTAADHFGVARDDLLNDEGYAVLDAYTEGTWTLGEDFWTGVEAQIDGAPVTFEAMSLMVHPANTPLPYRDPLDALTSIEVCTVNDATLDLSEAQLYVGLIAYTDSPDGELSFTFPNVTPSDIAFNVRDFTDHRLTLQTQAWSGEGGDLTIPAATKANEPLFGGLSLVFASLAMVSLGLVATRGTGLFAA